MKGMVTFKDRYRMPLRAIAVRRGAFHRDGSLRGDGLLNRSTGGMFKGKFFELRDLLF